MRKFIKTFLAFYRGYAWVPNPEWTDGDSITLGLFLKTPTGNKFLNSLKSQGFEQDRLSTLDNKSTWQGGVATGVRIAIALHQSLSAVPAVEEDEYEAIPERSGKNRFAQHNQIGDIQ